jgi:DNA-binding transcriptional LysR family regulator
VKKLDTNWLEDFVCLARVLSFTKAAQERNITQSAFSRRIRSLELWVGIDLIDRRTFPASLSSAGHDFLPVARLVLAELVRSRDELRSNASSIAGTVRFTAPHSVSIHNLTPLLIDLEGEVPNLRTRVTSDNLHNCCDHLAHGNCDFMMCHQNPKVPITLDQERFKRLDIGTDKLVPVCAGRLDTLARRWMLPGNAKRPIPYLCYSSGTFLGAVVETSLASKGAFLKLRHTDAFAEALKSVCMRGAGLAWLPISSIQRELRSGELVVMGGEEWHFPLTLTIFAEPASLTKQEQAIWQFFEKSALAKES